MLTGFNYFSNAPKFMHENIERDCDAYLNENFINQRVSKFDS